MLDSTPLKTQPSLTPGRPCVKPVVLAGTTLWETTLNSLPTSAMDADCHSRLGATMMTALQVTYNPLACEQPMSTSLTTLTTHLSCMLIAEPRAACADRSPRNVISNLDPPLRSLGRSRKKSKVGHDRVLLFRSPPKRRLFGRSARTPWLGTLQHAQCHIWHACSLLPKLDSPLFPHVASGDEHLLVTSPPGPMTPSG